MNPTRELATQTQKVISAIGDYMQVQAHACIGGKSVGEDIRKLDYGVHVVSGTPGRVFDMIRRRNLRTRNIKTLILDEADEMLNQGFKEQIYDVYRYLPPQIQVLLISATLPKEILEMTSKFMTDPIRILVKRDELTLEGIKQFFVGARPRRPHPARPGPRARCSLPRCCTPRAASSSRAPPRGAAAVEREEWKFDTLCDLYDTLTITQVPPGARGGAAWLNLVVAVAESRRDALGDSALGADGASRCWHTCGAPRRGWCPVASWRVRARRG